jgi:hypothetical protein
VKFPLFTRLRAPLGLSEIVPLKVAIEPLVAARVKVGALAVLLLVTTPLV